MSETDPLVSLRHMRMAGVCANGAREWFQRYELSWIEFVRDGLPASVIEATGDGIALRVAAEARREASGATAAAEVTSEPEPLPVEPEPQPDVAEIMRAMNERAAAAAKDLSRVG